MKRLIVWLITIHLVRSLQYICNNNDHLILKSSIQTDNFYPITLSGDSDIPITLGVNNYIYEELSTLYHEIDVKVIKSPFQGLYIAYPAIVPQEGFYENRFRDNLGELFRIRYSTPRNVSCLSTNLIQFKMIFADEQDNLYNYYFGNCNGNEVSYDSEFNASYCINHEFICYDQAKNRCDQADYGIALEQALLNGMSLEDNSISITGYYPTTSLSCFNNQPCTLTKYSTYSSISSNTMKVISNEIIPQSDNYLPVTSLLTTNYTPEAKACNLTPPFHFFLFFLYYLGY